MPFMATGEINGPAGPKLATNPPGASSPTKSILSRVATRLKSSRAATVTTPSPHE